MLNARAAGMKARISPRRSDPATLAAEKSTVNSVCSDRIRRVKFPSSKTDLELLPVTIELLGSMVCPDNARSSLTVTSPLTRSKASDAAESDRAPSETPADRFRTVSASENAMNFRLREVRAVGKLFSFVTSKSAPGIHQT